MRRESDRKKERKKARENGVNQPCKRELVSNTFCTRLMRERSRKWVLLRWPKYQWPPESQIRRSRTSRSGIVPCSVRKKI